MGRPVKQIAGLTFGRLTAMEVVGRDVRKQALWRFICRCGKHVVRAGSKVSSGGISSCGCYRRELNHRPRPTVPLAERFWRHVARSQYGCWEWTAATDKQTGYGRIGVGGRAQGTRSAHRVSFELHNGPVPAGKLVCHHCDNRKCVRPDHLYAGTYTENLKDAWSRGDTTKRRAASTKNAAIARAAKAG